MNHHRSLEAAWGGAMKLCRSTFASDAHAANGTDTVSVRLPSLPSRKHGHINRLVRRCGRLPLEAVVILGLTEAASWVWNHVPLLQFPNFRAMRMDAALAGKGAQYDAVLAWVPIP